MATVDTSRIRRNQRPLHAKVFTDPNGKGEAATTLAALGEAGGKMLLLTANRILRDHKDGTNFDIDREAMCAHIDAKIENGMPIAVDIEGDHLFALRSADATLRDEAVAMFVGVLTMLHDRYPASPVSTYAVPAVRWNRTGFDWSIIEPIIKLIDFSIAQCYVGKEESDGDPTTPDVPMNLKSHIEKCRANIRDVRAIVSGKPCVAFASPRAVHFGTLIPPNEYLRAATIMARRGVAGIYNFEPPRLKVGPGDPKPQNVGDNEWAQHVTAYYLTKAARAMNCKALSVAWPW